MKRGSMVPGSHVGREPLFINNRGTDNLLASYWLRNGDPVYGLVLAM